MKLIDFQLLGIKTVHEFLDVETDQKRLECLQKHNVRVQFLFIYNLKSYLEHNLIKNVPN